MTNIMNNTNPSYSSRPESTSRQQSSSVFTKHKLWWLVLFIVCLVCAFFPEPDKLDGEIRWAYAVGGLFGLFSFAFVITGIPWLVSILIRRKMTSVQFMVTYSLAIGLGLAPKIERLINSRSDGDNLTNVVSTSIFGPKESDFSITFSDVPTIEDFEVLATNGMRFKGVRAEYRANDSFQRAEVILMPQGFLTGETEESALSKLRDYAFQNGINAAELMYVISDIGPKASMRGTKILEDNGKQRAVTYEAISYYGDSSLFSIYVGSPSESYPPTRVVNFLQSIKKNEN